MAVAEAKKMDKEEREPAEGAGLPGFLAGPVQWVPRKYGELRTFLSEVRSELKKVTWPDWPEVYQTTLVVIATTIFFGCYLYTLDLGFSWVLQHVLR